MAGSQKLAGRLRKLIAAMIRAGPRPPACPDGGEGDVDAEAELGHARLAADQFQQNPRTSQQLAR
jgi:hypothetical protein